MNYKLPAITRCKVSHKLMAGMDTDVNPSSAEVNVEKELQFFVLFMYFHCSLYCESVSSYRL